MKLFKRKTPQSCERQMQDVKPYDAGKQKDDIPNAYKWTCAKFWFNHLTTTK